MIIPIVRGQHDIVMVVMTVNIFQNKSNTKVNTNFMFIKLPWPGDREISLQFSSQAATCRLSFTQASQNFSAYLEYSVNLSECDL